MPSAHETAYPRLKSRPSPHELAMVYTPTKDEVVLAERVTRSGVARLGFLRRAYRADPGLPDRARRTGRL